MTGSGTPSSPPPPAGVAGGGGNPPEGPPVATAPTAQREISEPLMPYDTDTGNPPNPTDDQGRTRAVVGMEILVGKSGIPPMPELKIIAGIDRLDTQDWLNYENQVALKLQDYLEDSNRLSQLRLIIIQASQKNADIEFVKIMRDICISDEDSNKTNFDNNIDKLRKYLDRQIVKRKANIARPATPAVPDAAATTPAPAPDAATTLAADASAPSTPDPVPASNARVPDSALAAPVVIAPDAPVQPNPVELAKKNIDNIVSDRAIKAAFMEKLQDVMDSNLVDPEAFEAIGAATDAIQLEAAILKLRIMAVAKIVEAAPNTLDPEIKIALIARLQDEARIHPDRINLVALKAEVGEITSEEKAIEYCKKLRDAQRYTVLGKLDEVPNKFWEDRKIIKVAVKDQHGKWIWQEREPLNSSEIDKFKANMKARIEAADLIDDDPTKLGKYEFPLAELNVALDVAHDKGHYEDVATAVEKMGIDDQRIGELRKVCVPKSAGFSQAACTDLLLDIAKTLLFIFGGTVLSQTQENLEK